MCVCVCVCVCVCKIKEMQFFCIGCTVCEYGRAGIKTPK